MTLHIDLETGSALDLKKTGTHRYATHPSTRVWCVAWAIGDDPVQVWKPGDPIPQEIVNHVLLHGGTVTAWNAAGFERLLWAGKLVALGFPPVQDHQWRCTMVRAAYWGLPMSLDQAGQALHLGLTKDMAGHRLMLQCCRPRNLKAAPNGPWTWWPEDEPEKYAALMRYCGQDVEVEREVERWLPELPDYVLRLWQLDTKIMSRGWKLDLPMVEKLAALSLAEGLRLNADVRALTNGAVSSTNAVAALLRYVNDKMQAAGLLPLKGLDKETVAQVLKEKNLPLLARRALEIRQEAAKSSVAKLTSMASSVCEDGAIRGLTQFYGASRTGRWAGRLVQIQNLPRPTIKQVALSIDAIQNGADVETITDIFGRPLDVVASALRGVFVPRQGKTLIVGDFSQIEARVVAWLAGQQDILDVFASGEDVYVYTAAKLGSKDRQLGKVLVLACGFGMGWEKFQATAKSPYQIILTDEEAQDAVRGWRDANPKIVQLWWDLDRAARRVLEGQAKQVQVGKLTVAMGTKRLAGCLLIRLPSGRHLVYRRARLVEEESGKTSICYDGVNQKTRRWETLRTYGGKLAENVTQAVAADCLGEALTRLEANGFPVLATIHDEVVVEIDDTGPHTTELLRQNVERTMTLRPKWAQGLPVGSEVRIMPRYGK
jgi:DNA polymerase